MAYRIIYSLYFDLGQPPDGLPGSSTALCVALDRHGIPHGPSGGGNGHPQQLHACIAIFELVFASS